MDERRRVAAELFAGGASRAHVARALSVSRSTASHWHRLWAKGGAGALLRAGQRGRRARLDRDALARVRAVFDGPPRAVGYDLDTWSLNAIAAAIRRASGVSYHPRHAPRILRRLGWVVLPVGASARHAFRQVPLRDPDGNACVLRRSCGGAI